MIPRRRLSFQTKLLVPVITIMVLLVLAGVGVVNRRIARQLEGEAAERLATADAVLHNSQEIRAKNLLLRYRNLPSEPRLKAVAQLADANTMRFLLRELVVGLGADVVQYTTDRGQPLADASRHPLLNAAEFASHSAGAVKLALQGEPTAETISIGARLLDAVSIPVRLDDHIVGVLTIGTEFGSGVAQEFRQLTHSEIVFVAQGQIVASTLGHPEWNQQLPLTRPYPRSGALRGIVLGQEHFFYRIGHFDSTGGDAVVSYVLLSNCEPLRRTLRATQWALSLLGVVSVLASIVVVWALVRRITQPLRQLRDSAEAVGQGDFSRRVTVAARDECGELAAAFNGMLTQIQKRDQQLQQRNQTLQAEIVERQRAEEKLKAVAARLEGHNRELQDLAYVSSHDLQEPLRKLQVFGDRLKMKYAGALDEQGRDYIERMHKAAGRMQTLVTALLSYSRVTTQAQPFVPVDLGQVAREVLGDLEVRLEQTHGSVELGELPALEADPLQMRQLLQNLIGNALKFRRDHARPVIKVYARPLNGTPPSPSGNGARCQLFVEDNGIGFDMKYLDRIFGVFQRLHGRDEYEGTGVGLAICRKIAERHSGSITAQSKPGEGATFIVTLPIHQLNTEGAKS